MGDPVKCLTQGQCKQICRVFSTQHLLCKASNSESENTVSQVVGMTLLANCTQIYLLRSERSNHQITALVCISANHKRNDINNNWHCESKPQRIAIMIKVTSWPKTHSVDTGQQFDACKTLQAEDLYLLNQIFLPKQWFST